MSTLTCQQLLRIFIMKFIQFLKSSFDYSMWMICRGTVCFILYCNIAIPYLFIIIIIIIIIICAYVRMYNYVHVFSVYV